MTPQRPGPWAWIRSHKVSSATAVALVGIVVAALAILRDYYDWRDERPMSATAPNPTPTPAIPNTAPPSSSPSPVGAATPSSTGTAPASAAASARPPLVIPTAPSATPSDVPLSGPLNGTGSSYLNLDVVPVAVTGGAGTDRTADLHVEPGQVTPMNNASLGIIDRDGGCADMREDPPARPFTPGGFCGRTRAGRFFSVTFVRGDGTELKAFVRFP